MAASPFLRKKGVVMATHLLIICGVALGIYYLSAVIHQSIAKNRKTGFGDFISSSSWVIGIRLIMVAVSIVLFFGGAALIEPVIAMMCTGWILFYSTVGIANSASSFVNTLAFYEWSSNRYAPFTGLLTAVSFVLLSAIAAGVL